MARSPVRMRRLCRGEQLFLRCRKKIEEIFGVARSFTACGAFVDAA
jgi:hypothetical protein